MKTFITAAIMIFFVFVIPAFIIIYDVQDTSYNYTKFSIDDYCSRMIKCGAVQGLDAKPTEILECFDKMQKTIAVMNKEQIKFVEAINWNCRKLGNCGYAKCMLTHSNARIKGAGIYETELKITNDF